MNRLDHALALARQGLLIFPLRPRTKEPFSRDDFGGKGWKEIMTTDEAVIRGWFTTLPDMNYGVCGGNFFCILDPDVDTARSKDGLATFVEMQEREDPSDMVYGATFEVKSPRGGRHLYLRTTAPVKNSASTFAVGVDVRGGDGYVVGPGSYTDADAKKSTAAGEYVVVNDSAIIDAPEWVMKRMESALAKSKDVDNPATEWDTDFAVEAARTLIRQATVWPTEGSHGDQDTLQFCMALRDYCVSDDTCFDLLHESLYEDGTSWNERCDPPWDDEGLARKIRNAYKYADNQPGSKGGTLAAEGDLGASAAEDATKAEKLKRFADLVANTFAGGSLMSRAVSREMVIPEWMPLHGMTQVLAKRGIGKTILTLDVALRGACEMDWHGQAIKPGLVWVYACGEDDLGLQEQMKAWHSVHKRKPADDRFIVITKVPNLMDVEDCAAWVEYLRTTIPEGSRCVFFLDTWQRASARASQNDEEQMQLATDNAEGIGTLLGGTLVANFHPPKHNEGTISGSQIVENKGGALWGLSKHGDQATRLLKVLRIKGKGEGNTKIFDWREVSWGEFDEFGNKRTGIVPHCDGGTGMEESEASIQNRHSARHYYASLIEEMLMQHRAEGINFTDADFTVKDTCRRIVKFMSMGEGNAQWKVKFNSARDFAWNTKEDNLRKHLSFMFNDNDPPQRTETGRYVNIVRKKKNSSHFEIVDAPNKALTVEDDNPYGL